MRSRLEDARRMVILRGLHLDAAMKYPAWESRLNDLMGRISRDQIEAIYDLLKMGPTSANVQPARFVFCLSQDSREKLASVASEANAAKIRKAPAAVGVGMDMDFPEKIGRASCRERVCQYV